jgi:translation elongation factor EF-G
MAIQGRQRPDILALCALGKTTTTERMLHYAGVTRKIGGE